MRVRRARMLAALALSVPLAAGAAVDGSFAVEGAGQVSCQRFVDEREANSQAYYMMMGWVQGYMTAYNRLSEDTVDVTPWQQPPLIEAVLGGFCKSQPDAQFAEAVDIMVEAWRPTRLRASSEQIEASADGRSVALYEATLMRAQQLLAELGHYDGAVDGSYGPGTKGAFLAFQRAEELPETGLPDQRTLFLLFQ